MNILIFSWRGPGHPQEGGAEQSTHEHAKAWVKAGHRVTLFTSHFSGAKKEEEINDVAVIRRGNLFPGVHLAAAKWYLFDRQQKFDLVVDQFHGIPFFTPLYVRTKKLAFIHEVAKEVWWLNPWPKPLNLIPGIIGSLLEAFVFRIFYMKTPFMTVSNSTKSDLVRWGIPKKDITVIHNGIKVSLPKKVPRKEKIKTLIYLGALAKDKGFEDAIKIFNLVKRQSSTLRGRKAPDWQFWVVGKSDDKYRTFLKEKVKEFDLKNNLKYWGFVSDQKKFELLSRAHVLINPSVREGWGLVNIEANTVGTPVVGYNVPGIRDSVKHKTTGILVEKNNTEILAQETLKLIKNKKLYDNLQKNAFKWSQRFSWEKSTRESLKLLKRL